MIKAFLLTLTFGVLSILSVQPVLATETSQYQIAANPILIQEGNGTIYLSTETTKGGEAVSVVRNATSSSRETTTPNQQLQDIDISIPRGFASTFSGLINGVLSFVLIISALLVLFFLLSGGFDWITSGGDKGKTEKARDKITAAVIGLIIVAASFAILNLVIRFLGFSSLNDIFDNAGTINGGAPTNFASSSAVVVPTPVLTPTPTPLP